MNQRGQMSLFVPGLGQHGMQQYGTPSQKQIQIIQQQQQLLMHEIALKKECIPLLSIFLFVDVCPYVLLERLFRRESLFD